MPTLCASGLLSARKERCGLPDQIAEEKGAGIRYLKSQRLGRLATAGPDGQPHVVQVGFRYKPKEVAIEIDGHSGFSKRKNAATSSTIPRVAFVVDDVASVNPGTVRGIEVRGHAECEKIFNFPGCCCSNSNEAHQDIPISLEKHRPRISHPEARENWYAKLQQSTDVTRRSE